MSDERDDIANPDPGDERVSRRDFLRYAGVGAAAGAVGAGVLGCATVGAETTAGGAKGPAFDRGPASPCILQVTALGTGFR